MRNKLTPESLHRAVMSLCKGAKTKEKVGTHLSEVLEVNVGVHQGSALTPLLFVIVINAATNKIKQVMLKEILNADNLVLIMEAMAELQ